MKKLYMVSLGCTKNLVDSEVMLGRLKDYQLSDKVEDADVIIVNTCGFINSAKEESLSTIFELHSRRKKDSLLVMTGCLSERYKEELKKELVEVDLFTGVGDYAKIDQLIAKKEDSFSPVYLIQDEERVITNSNYHAYIKLSEGCNQQCSFCSIPIFKGKLQSRPLELVVDEIKRLVDRGFKDFTFVSQDSSSYLRDFGKREGLIELIEEVEKIEGVKSGRILYLYPSTTSFELVEAIANSQKIVNYFDIPIQHISDKMLKVMKRGANKERTLKLLEKMREVEDSFLRSAFIVGHPQEEQSDFLELKKFLERFEFDRVTLFEYSPEDGTASYLQEPPPKEIIQQRLEILEEIVQKQLEESLKKEVGREVEGYLDGKSPQSELLFSAREKRWAPQIDGEILINESFVKELKVGELYKIKITQLVGDKLLGTVIATLS